MNNLATIQKIREILPHNNADALEIAKVLGWNVVVKKGEFEAGDLCVYICIDSVVPETPEFEFLRNKHFRIKPIRLRGQESAGICFPLSILTNVRSVETPPSIGEDVTDILKVVHYEKPVSAELAGVAVHMMIFSSWCITTIALALTFVTLSLSCI